jgi:hypothetical protein
VDDQGGLHLLDETDDSGTGPILSMGIIPFCHQKKGGHSPERERSGSNIVSLSAARRYRSFRGNLRDKFQKLDDSLSFRSGAQASPQADDGKLAQMLTILASLFTEAGPPWVC